jgi:hypothetical protein
MRKNVRPVALLILVSNVLLCRADQITRTFVLDPVTLGITEDPSLDTQKAVQTFLKGAGVDFGATPKPKFFYNRRTGILHVTSDSASLAGVDRALRENSPPQVLIKVVLAEVSETEKGQVDNLLGVWRPDSMTWPDALEDLLKSPRQELFSRVITENQARRVIAALEKREGTDLLSAPASRTASGRQVRVQYENEEAVIIPPFHAPSKRTQAIIDSFMQ